MTLRVHVHGAKGRMGGACVAAIEAAGDMELCGVTSRGDDLVASLAAGQPQVAVEFTVPDAVEQSVATILDAGVHVVSGTTGLSREKAEALGVRAKAKGLGFLLAPNFAIGVLLMQRFACEAAKHFPDLEILEYHHEQKLDAPSGTALHTAQLIRGSGHRGPSDRPESCETIPGVRGGKEGEIPIHSIRLPGLLAHQEVMFGGVGQVLTIRHDAMDRRAFMPGVLHAVRQIHEHRGLVDSLDRLL